MVKEIAWQTEANAISPSFFLKSVGILCTISSLHFKSYLSYIISDFNGPCLRPHMEEARRSGSVVE